MFTEHSYGYAFSTIKINCCETEFALKRQVRYNNPFANTPSTCILFQEVRFAVICNFIVSRKCAGEAGRKHLP